jgi:predicted acylesterase/phospholipase RssA
MRTLDDHFTGPGPKRILALDGGGVRGVMTCAILEAMEEALRRRLPESEREDFRLCDYFDLIGGTSTGAIIATWLALGHKAAETRKLYLKLAGDVFGETNLLSQIGVKEKFDAAVFQRVTDKAFADFVESKGRQRDYVVHLHDKLIRTGLALFAKRIDRASPWIVHNNPRGKFWDAEDPLWKAFYDAHPEMRGTPNTSFDLRRFVQASASAPYFLEPVERTIATGVTGSFVDGGVSPHNNPSLQLLLMATLKWRERPPGAPAQSPSPLGFGWDTGEDKLLMVSVGTGYWRKEPEGVFRSLAGHRALHALTTMIDDTSLNAVTWLQALSRPARPYTLNLELEDMAGLRILDEPLLSYTRIEAKLDPGGLADLLGAEGVRQFAGARAPDEGSKKVARMIKRLRKLDDASPANLRRLAEIGEEIGARFFAVDGNAYQVLPRAFDLSPS